MYFFFTKTQMASYLHPVLKYFVKKQYFLQLSKERNSFKFGHFMTN